MFLAPSPVVRACVLLMLLFAGCAGGKTSEEALNPERQDVTWESRTQSGFVAFLDVDNSLGAEPQLVIPSGQTPLYNESGERTGQVDIAAYRTLADAGQGRVLWGQCFEVNDLAHPLFNNRNSLSTWMCAVTLSKLEAQVDGDLYVLGELRYVRGGEPAVDHPFGSVLKLPEEALFFAEKNVTLVEFGDGEDYTVVDAGLLGGSSVRIDANATRNADFHQTRADSGLATAVFYRVQSGSFDELVPIQ